MKSIHLLIIDGQVDFCDPAGALYVKGADQDMIRLAAMIDRLGGKIDDIHVTLDSHHDYHIAHPLFWKDTAGNHPAPFTLISADEVKNGKWIPALPSWQRRAVDYVESLQKNNRYQLCIWPEHCLIGSPGACIYPPLFASLRKWVRSNIGAFNPVTKGSNFYTEHYSAVVADVPDSQDPSTQLNTDFIKTLMEADILLVAGEARNFCLANTVRDVANGFNDDSYIKKMYLITDATSDVPGFGDLGDNFVRDMSLKGMNLTTTDTFLK
jgi:nicotinamidase-related amidase